jgi:hypothetical protein
MAALLLGRTREASRLLGRAIELEPRLTDAARVLGELQYREGDVPAAVRTYELALTTAPADLAMRERLEAWRRELAAHRGLVTRNDGRFSIVFEGSTDRALAEHAVAALDEAYWRIGGALNSYPTERIIVTLYTDEQFRALTNAPDWAAGVFDGRIRIRGRGALERVEDFDRVLVHELTHALVHMIAPRGVPAWLHEGLAGYFEPLDPAQAVTVLKKTGFLPLERLMDGFDGLSGPEVAVAYMQSLVVTNAIMERVGTRMGIVLQGLGRGQSVEIGLRQVGVSMADLEGDLEAVFGPQGR